MTPQPFSRRRLVARMLLTTVLVAQAIGAVLAAEWTSAAAPGDMVRAVFIAPATPAAPPIFGPAVPFDHPDLARDRLILHSSVAPAVPTAPATPPAKPAAAPVVRPSAPLYVGRNHLWIPSLGMSRSVSFFACDRATPPGDLVYRWGCAGANNTYLFGHKESVFKPLHDAYATGRLHTGMKVIYADGAGRVHTYRVVSWRLVSPEDIDWAIAAQPTPSMTLQTCYGSNSHYRLLVRLVRSA